MRNKPLCLQIPDAKVGDWESLVETDAFITTQGKNTHEFRACVHATAGNRHVKCYFPINPMRSDKENHRELTALLKRLDNGWGTPIA